jgi:hypothetical protein
MINLLPTARVVNIIEAGGNRSSFMLLDAHSTGRFL